MAGHVTYQQHDRVAVVTFSRPERRNAMTGAMEAAYLEHLERAEQDPGIRAVVVTGAGSAYCAGGDLDRLDGLVSRGGIEHVQRGDRYLRTMGMAKPVIAAINGPCVGLGALQAVACDIRLAAPSATFSFPFVRLGLVAEEGIPWILPRIVGFGRAMDLLISGRTLGAADALQIGLVSGIHTDVLESAMSLASDIARRCSPTAMAVVKAQLHRASDLAGSLAESRALVAKALRRADTAEGIASFREGRTPEFGPLNADAVGGLYGGFGS